MNDKIIQAINTNKIIVICRGLYDAPLLNLVKALYEGGIRLVEVTYDQKDPKGIEKTTCAIRMLKDEFGDKMGVGAGTVLTIEQVKATKQAGGEYIISPNTNLDVISVTKECGLVSIPGAMTPSEIIAAHFGGADFVKLFPAATLGLKYAKDILGPINQVKFIATAGVNEDNFKDFLDLGFAGAGISGRLTDKGLVSEGNFKELETRAKRFVEIAKS
jgi:2-dehydro-3-deoxyphosphogluconate aldolase/(4S)-4-hydroxy-2-oxoglutarate aldolase